MIVVSDASPLIALAAVGQLDLLHDLYGEVLVPEAVQNEVTLVRPAAPGAAAVSLAGWIRVLPVQNLALVAAMSVELDPGEAEAIALAVEEGADLLLIDERRGRIAASRLNQRVVGVLGILVEAKQRNLISLVRPVLDALASQTGFRVSQALRDRILLVAGE